MSGLAISAPPRKRTSARTFISGWKRRRRTQVWARDYLDWLNDEAGAQVSRVDDGQSPQQTSSGSATFVAPAAQHSDRQQISHEADRTQRTDHVHVHEQLVLAVVTKALVRRRCRHAWRHVRPHDRWRHRRVSQSQLPVGPTAKIRARLYTIIERRLTNVHLERAIYHWYYIFIIINHHYRRLLRLIKHALRPTRTVTGCSTSYLLVCANCAVLSCYACC